MLHFVQQIGRDGPQTRDHRPKCCTIYSIEPQIGVIPPILLYKIQHLRAFLKFADNSRAKISGTAGDDR
nr:hypothetical protein [Paenibacillus ginsengihumi]